MQKQSKTPLDFNDVIELIRYFDTEEKCLQYIVEMRWCNEIRCTHCDSSKIYKFSDGKRYKCGECGTHFTALVGTIFQDTKLPLIKWLTAMYFIGTDKRGISTRNLAAKIRVSVKTAWFLLHRIRESMKQPKEKLEGVIEADETFIGGKNKNRHIDKKVKNSQGRSYKDKVPVFGAKERDGKLRTVIIDNTKVETIKAAIISVAKERSTVYSDEWIGYSSLSDNFNHGVIDHRKKQFREGDICTNGIECAWSHLKRMIFGVYYKVSKKHLQRYLNEFTFRYNTRSINECTRLKEMMKNIQHPLKYNQLIAA